MVDDVYDYTYSSTFSLDMGISTRRTKRFVLLLVCMLMFVLCMSSPLCSSDCVVNRYAYVVVKTRIYSHGFFPDFSVHVDGAMLMLLSLVSTISIQSTIKKAVQLA